MDSDWRMEVFKKKDLILIGSVLALCLIAYGIIQLVVKQDGTMVVIKVDGQVQHEISINEEQEFIVEGYDGGSNRVVIANGQVSMTDADCPDKLCVNMGIISRTGETIVCLPHRVVVEITGGESQVDSVVR